MTTIAESAPLATGTGSRWRARLLAAPIQGSSGYYPAETVRRDGPTAFPAGTPIFFDHPGVAESEDRPERSVRDLAGKIATTPAFESDGLYADIEFYSWASGVVKEMGSDIGLSIRAFAEATSGSVNGKQTAIITRLVEGLSVDLVTRAGAGGKLVSLLESARPAATETAVTGDVVVLAEAPARDRRDQLQRALQGAYGDPDRDRYPWLADFDDVARVCWYEDGRETWQQSYTVATDDLSVALTGERFEVRPVTAYHPVDTSAGPVGESSPAAHTIQKEQHMPQIEEARLAELTAAANRVTALEAERDSAIQRAEAAEADARRVAREAYDTQVVAALAASDLPTPARDRVADALTLGESDQVPATPATVIEAAIAAERDYVASLAPVLGKVEPPRRLGFGAAPEPVTESYTNPWGRTINPVKEA